MKKHLMIATAVLVGLGLSTAAQAAPATGTFQVLLTVKKMCNVTAGSASNISLGSVAAGTTNVTGSNTIKVNCSKTTPYNVGLAPSNGVNTGLGSMAGSPGNTDTVAYQLYSDAAYSVAWGNTATATSVGNGVAGTGAGMGTSQANTLTVYAKAPTTDVTPDNYTDTVTVNVNY